MGEYDDMLLCGFLLMSGALAALGTVGLAGIILLALLNDYWNRWQDRYETVAGRVQRVVNDARESSQRFASHPGDDHFWQETCDKIIAELDCIPKTTKEKQP